MDAARNQGRWYWSPAIRDFVCSVGLLAAALGIAIMGIVSRSRGRGARRTSPPA
ncbi:MAG: hypothetical protein P8Z74_12840 [Acidobacteriota bacterium]